MGNSPLSERTYVCSFQNFDLDFFPHWVNRKVLSPNRVFRVAYVTGCPDVKRPAYCPLTPLPLQAVVLFAS